MEDGHLEVYRNYKATLEGVNDSNINLPFLCCISMPTRELVSGFTMGSEVN